MISVARSGCRPGEKGAHDTPLVDLLSRRVLVLIDQVLSISFGPDLNYPLPSLTLFMFSSISRAHSSGTQVCTKLAHQMSPTHATPP